MVAPSGTLYGQILRELRTAGMRPDDAAMAADVCERAMRQRRDEVIQNGRACGMSARKLAKMWGLSHVQILRLTAKTIVVRMPSINVPPDTKTLDS